MVRYLSAAQGVGRNFHLSLSKADLKDQGGWKQRMILKTIDLDWRAMLLDQPYEVIGLGARIASCG